MKSYLKIILILLAFNCQAQNDSLGVITPTIVTDSLLKVIVVDSSAVEIGIASFYAKKFEGRKCANGEIFKHDKLTAAHKTLKLGTYVKVTNLRNDSSVIVKVNDRLPKKSKRNIDLTMRAAKQLNFVQRGLTKVKIEKLLVNP
jgi:rare lipoprotein A